MHKMYKCHVDCKNDFFIEDIRNESTLYWESSALLSPEIAIKRLLDR